MKYRLGSITIEAIGTFVRINHAALNKTQVTKKEFPTSAEVADMLSGIQGYYPNSTQLQACGRAADDARNNETVLAI